MENRIYYIASHEKEAALQVETQLSHLIRSIASPQKSLPAFVCIGSDRVTGDSLGPLIGSQLRKSLPETLPVYGTLEAPLHALNLNHILPGLLAHCRHHIIIAIDASLGIREHQGYITLGRGCLAPGAGVDKVLEPVGDLFLTGIIGTSGPFSHLALQTARLSTVMNVAAPMIDGILRTCQNPSLFSSAIPALAASAVSD